MEIFQYLSIKADGAICDKVDYRYEIDKVMAKTNEIFPGNAYLLDEDLPTLVINVLNQFFVKIVFSFDYQIDFIVAHGENEEKLDPLEQSCLFTMKAISIYLGKIFSYFNILYKENGLINFINFLKTYDRYAITPCKKCGKIIIKDDFNAIVPPIIRDPINGDAYHVKCASIIEGIGDLGFAKA